MARPLQKTPPVIPNGGINEAVSPSALEPRYWASALDVEPLPSGARTRQGYTVENGVALPGSVQGSFGYKLSDDPAEYHLVVANGGLYANEAGVMRLLGSGLLTGADDFASAAVGGDAFLVTNGGALSKKFYYDGSTEHYENEGIDAPSATPSLASTTGTLAAGDWFIDYRYRNDNASGSPASNPRFGGLGSVGASNHINLGAPGGIAITALPSAVQRAGDGATHIEVYLSAGSGGVPGTFFYAGEVTLGTTTYTISSDTRTTQALEFDNNVPPKHTMKLIAGGYQFIAGIDGLPGRVGFSKIDGALIRYESFPATNFRDFGRRVGDDVTALAFIAPRTLVVGFKDSIWAIDARNPKLGDPVRVAQGVGIAGKNAFVVVGRNLFFVSDAARSKGMYAWDGAGDVRPLFTAQNGIDKTFKSLNQGRLQYASCAHYAPGDNRYQWWTLVASSGSTHDRVIVYDYQLDAWTIYRLTGTVLSAVVESGRERLYLGTSDGYEHQLDAGTQDDGSDIGSEMTLGEWNLGDITALKHARWVRYIAQTFADGAISMRVECDHGTRKPGLASLSHFREASGGTFVLGTSLLGGSDTLGGSGSVNLANRRASIRCSGRSLQIKFESSKPWFLRLFELAFQVSGRR